MSPEEWDAYMTSGRVEPVIKGSEFLPPGDGEPMRLLCRGYHANGGPNLRVWLRDDAKIGVQENDGDIVFSDQWATHRLYPSKRAYREFTDLTFALLMRERHDYPLSFTTWLSER